ncbi:hypothetical protein M885DRAFT_560216 [Pelagophyceae sp. CCMP2097]|nr:hypothetical protein M885DRAFT_560216 [Pelagophyceae sp. CCMP2097]
MPSLPTLLCLAVLLRGVAGTPCICEDWKGQAETLTPLCGRSGSGPMGSTVDCIPTEAYRLQAGGEYTFKQTEGFPAAFEVWTGYNSANPYRISDDVAECSFDFDYDEFHWKASKREVLMPGFLLGHSGFFDWTCSGRACRCRNDNCDRECPCGKKWESNRDYVRCCQRNTDAQVSEGLIDAAEQDALMTSYRESGCGRP